MKLNFGGIVPISTIDWYGRASLVIFFRGCPFRCIYCHNKELINGIDLVDIETIKNKILNTSSFISAVVFSGGEPTMQSEPLVLLAQYAKGLNLDVGIQTNGYYPYVIEELISLSLVDKISIDVKAPLDPNIYEKVVGIRAKRVVKCVAKTLDILKSSTVCFEVITTVFKSFFERRKSCIDYITSIAEILKDYKCTYVIQNGNNTFSRNELIELALHAAMVSNNPLLDVRIRTKEFGEESITHIMPFDA